MKPPTTTPRILPPQFKNVIEVEFLRRLTWKERIQILMGFNVTILMRGLTEHRPGKCEWEMHLSTTPVISKAHENSKA